MNYSPIADHYDRDIAKDLNEDKLVFELLTLAGISNSTGGRILDVGCGSGIQTQFLAGRFEKIKQIVGIDNSQELINLARNRNNDARCEYIVADMHHIPFENDWFDFIYSRYALHYSQNLRGVLDELFRICKPGGQAFIQVVHPIYELFIKPGKDYVSGEEADFTPQTSSVRVRHVTHQVAEYVNSSVNANWHLINIEERFGGQSDIQDFHIPTVLILRLHKPEANR